MMLTVLQLQAIIFVSVAPFATHIFRHFHWSRYTRKASIQDDEDDQPSKSDLLIQLMIFLLILNECWPRTAVKYSQKVSKRVIMA